MDKTYPIDIHGVKRYGVEKWLDDYYIPVTGMEYYSIYYKVKTTYMELLKENQNDLVYWIGLSNIGIIRSLSMCILELLALSRLKKGGYKYIFGKENVEIIEDISTYNSPFLNNRSSLIVKSFAELNFYKRVKNILRTVGYNFRSLSLCNKNFIRDISNPYFFIGERSHQEVVSFCDENKISPLCMSPMLFVKNNTNNFESNYKTSCLIEFVNCFLHIVKNHYPIINDLVLECIRKEINEIFKLSFSFFCQNVRVFSNFKPKKLLITGLGNPIHRLFSSALRYTGSEVIGFSHGNAYIHSFHPEIFTELSTVDLFVSSSRGHKKIAKQAVKEFSLELRNCKITFIKNNFYIPLFRKLQKDIPVKKIKKIMVVGSILTSYFPAYTEYHTFAFLYNDLKLVKLLKRSGYYVIYKPRLDAINEVKSVFEVYADRVIINKFEDVYHYADCLLFSNLYSTTFGFSLLTNKPIVLMNVKGYYWYPRAFELVKKRCSVIEAEAVDGKIVFDEKELLNAIEDSINNINYDILYEFAF